MRHARRLKVTRVLEAGGLAKELVDGNWAFAWNRARRQTSDANGAQRGCAASQSQMAGGVSRDRYARNGERTDE
jgi:hypothetical protein